MPDPDHWMFDYYRLYQDTQTLLAFFPQNQTDKDDPERARLEHAAWHRFYKRQIEWRLPSISEE